MVTKEYLELRQLALQFSEQLADHPCARNKGDCCVHDFSISMGDAMIINREISEGNISPDKIRRAQERAKNPNIKSCAFLSERRTCSIYPYRPVVCAATGVAAWPKSDEEARKYYLAKRAGVVSVPLECMVTSMCPECHNELVRKGARVSMEVLEFSQKFLIMAKNTEYTRMNLFVASLTIPKKRR